MMLAETEDKLVTLEADLPRLAAALEQQMLGTALKQAVEATKTFDYQLGRFQALTRAAELLKDYIDAGSERNIRNAVEEAASFGEVMAGAADREQLAIVYRDFRVIEREVGNFHREVSNLLERYIAQCITPLMTLGQLLGRIGMTELSARLQRLGLEARQVMNGPALELADRVEAIETQRARVQGDLTALAQDPEVDAFLTSLGRGKTSLRSVTPAVLGWLTEHGAIDHFRVVPV